MLALLVATAHAGALSIDAEMVHPSAGDAAPGLNDAGTWRAGTVIGGFLAQYERNPLVLMAGHDAIGSVVGNRMRLDLVSALAVSDRVALVANMPAAAQFGSTFARDAADGPAIGDLGLGLRVGLVDTDEAALTARALLRAPTGSREAWVGEGKVHGEAGLSARFGTGDVRGHLDAGVALRQAVTTDVGVTAGPEGTLGVGVSGKVAPDWTLDGTALARAGFANFLGGGGENAIELLATAHGAVTRRSVVSFGVGRGFGGGLGTTDVRVLAGLQILIAPPEELVPVTVQNPEEFVPEEVVRETIELTPEPPPQPAWAGTELARVIGENIVLRDPIRFEVGTVKVVPESLPTLAYVATLVQPDTMLIIEGHTSDEGDFAYNYDLSNKRAKSIWEELVKAGVPAQRMSWRGLGEVAPAATSGAPSGSIELAANRRVVFWLVHLSRPAGVTETPGPTLLPWDGSPAPPPVAPDVAPAAPAVPAAPADPEPAPWGAP